MEPIIYKGQKVIMTELLAQVYDTDVKNISKNFTRNKSKFIEAKHYFFLDGEELQEFKGSHLEDEYLKFVPRLYLWTERGANRHCKILDTDKAWEQFDTLEETYFRVKHGQYIAICEAKYLSGVANYLRIQRVIMRDNGSTPKDIAEMSQTVCRKYNVPIPANFVYVSPYEQLMLIEKERTPANP